MGQDAGFIDYAQVRKRKIGSPLIGKSNER
jgi:hypothetical protein